MPPIIVAAIECKVVRISQTAIVGANGGSEISYGLAQTDNHRIGLSGRSVVPESASTEVIITASAIGKFNLGGSSNGCNFVGKIFEIVADHECCVVWIRPGTKPG